MTAPIPCCKAGYYSPIPSSSISNCTPCDAGMYSAVEGSSSCRLCPEGTYCPTAATVSPVACHSQYICAAGSTVQLSSCSAGTYMPYVPGGGPWCYQCFPGWYSNDFATECLSCPAGNYCGDYRTPSGGLPCPVGSYCLVGTSTPVPCPEASYSDTTGSVGCTSCPTGSYCPSGAVVLACVPGSYCPFMSAHPTVCPLSTYSATEGAASCSWCPIGSYCATVGIIDPPLCPVGSYCPFNSSMFIACPPASYSDSQGASACSWCPAGSYCAGVGSVAPVSCPKGSYCPYNSSAFIGCPAASYSGIQGAVSVGDCSWCPAGRYCNGTGTSVPLTCPAGSYCPYNSSAFIGCPAASYSGIQGASSAANCSWCPAGSYCPGIGNISPRTCPAGSYCPYNSSSSTPCPPRAYSDLGSVSCSWCPAGSYCPGNTTAVVCPTGCLCSSNSSAPVVCVAGTYASVAAQLCVNCSVGSYSSAASSACIKCAPGTFATSIQSPTCTLCPFATYAAYSAASACIPCPAMSGAAPLLQQLGATSCAYCPASASFYSTDSAYQGACIASSAYGNITSTNGNYWMVHLFTSSVPYVTFTRNVVADVILIGGGGRGGGVSSVGNSMPYGTYGGGGGGGTVVMYAGFQFNTSAVYSMTVGGSGQASTIYADSVPLFVAQPGGKGGDGVYNGDVVAVRGGQGGGGGGGCYNCTAAPGGGASQGNIVAGVSGLRTGCSANFSAGTLLPTQGSYYIGHAVGSDGQASNKMDVAYTAGYSSPGIRSPGILLGDGGSGYNYSDCGSLWEPCMTYLGTVYDSTAKSIVRAICGPTIPLFTNPFVTGVSQGGPGWLFHIDLKYSVNTDYPPNINSGSGGHGGRGYDYENGASGAIILRYTSITAQFPCAAGLFLLTQPIVTCAICLPGTFSLYNSTACTPCPLNTYNNIVQASSCTACPTNLMTPVVGGTRCCASPGYYLNSTGGANPCPANSFC